MAKRLQLGCLDRHVGVLVGHLGSHGVVLGLDGTLLQEIKLPDVEEGANVLGVQGDHVFVSGAGKLPPEPPRASPSATPPGAAPDLGEFWFEADPEEPAYMHVFKTIAGAIDGV